MDGMGKENILIEHIAALLDHLQARGVGLDQFLAAGGQLERFALPDSCELRAAYQTIRLMEHMPGGFLLCRADGSEEILFANRALLRIFQCSTPEELREAANGSFRGLVHPGDVAAVKERAQRQVDAGQLDLDCAEYRVIRRDGAVRWVEARGHFVRSTHSGSYFYVFMTDSTEQRLDRQEHTRRMDVIEGLSVNYESILYVNLDMDTVRPYRLSSRTRLQFEEKFQARPFGRYTADYVRTWVHPEDRELVVQATAAAYIREKLSENNTYYINYRVIENGELEYLQLRLARVNTEGPICHVVMGYRRIDAELRQEMEQKQLLADALGSANLAITAKNTFLSNMSHDMRTPLNAIFGFTSLARTHLQDPGAVSGCLDKVEVAGRQLLDLIDKVLEVSWAESKEAGMDEEACDLREIVEDVYGFLTPHAAEKNIDFTLDCSRLEHSKIFGGENKLRQLVMYLVNNAVTYTRPGGKVSLTVSEEDYLSGRSAAYQIAVSDTGIGISESFLRRLFEPFSRERNTTVSGVHGTGLGLTIAKNIVNMLGGTISVESEVGKGSTFTVNLRLRVQPQPAAPAVDADRHVLSGKRILLVDDNEINQELEMEILQELGFTVDLASDGGEAAKKVEDSAPGDYNLILMDIQMPVMDGWCAARAIRAMEDPVKASIPIIALSANVFESDVRMSMESGIDAHLKKPLDIPLLLQTITDISQKAHPQV